MHQFLYTIKKIQDTNIYAFLLAKKKCTVNAEVFRTILDICPRVKGKEFTDILYDETALTFLIDLGYNGPLNKHTNMFVDHMHQPWRTLAAIINKGKGSKGKKTAKESQETVDVSEESKPEPELAKKKTASIRVVKKKVTLSADDNIITDDLDAALELAKIMTEYVSESAKKKSSGRSSKSMVIQDTPIAPNSKPLTSKTKRKGAPYLTLQEQKATDIMQALKESKKTSRRH
nr:hypothetical protein [Tanacetum cinerariifolium]